MGIVKGEIVEHPDRNGLISNFQAGFTGCKTVGGYRRICLSLDIVLRK